jgi:hypothetical protein
LRRNFNLPVIWSIKWKIEAAKLFFFCMARTRKSYINL